MDEVKFWDVVGRAHAQAEGDMDEKCDAIRDAVAGLPQEEALAFSRVFDAMMDRAYHWPLWGAAYVIGGGCSDDAFTDFRAALISRGQQAFEGALADPESLADEEIDDEDDWFYEGYQYAVSDGVEAAAGFMPDRLNPHPDEPSGAAWEEDQLPELFPRLCARFD